ncbi:MAG: hypothetical protein ABI042_18315 [Verrucomicrobiota bacterium]
MNQKIPKHPRILAIALTTVGVGFAIFEGREVLVNWGVKTIEGDKNSMSVLRIKDLIAQYQPNLVVLEETSAYGTKRSSRTQALTKKIVALVKRDKIQVRLFSATEIRKAFFPEGEGTKQEIAEIIAKRFPEELAHRLPPKRRAWQREDTRMGIFDAVALALMITFKPFPARSKSGKRIQEAKL